MFVKRVDFTFAKLYYFKSMLSLKVLLSQVAFLIILVFIYAFLGFVEFIESIALSEVSKEKAIQKFLRQHNPSETGPYGIAAEVMDNYLKSCGKI